MDDNKNVEAKTVCFVSTIAWPINVYIRPYVKRISEEFKVIIAADGAVELSRAQYPRVDRFAQVDIRRKVNFWMDCVAFIQLVKLFRRARPYCVHSIMPKAGLLSMTAAVVAGVPVRFHTFTGQVWSNREGLVRFFLMQLDKIIASAATKVLADSESQRHFLISNKIVSPRKIIVLGNGSVVGVNTDRFRPSTERRFRCRREMGVAESESVFLFVGRINHEKGINDLVDAFSVIAEEAGGAHLVLVGLDEGDYGAYFELLPGRIRRRIQLIGFTDEPEAYMAAADAICLPSYREGFGSVLLEGAATGIPSIASRIYGITDAVIDGVTGILHEPRNVPQIVACMRRLRDDPSLRARMGRAGRERAVANFSEDLMVAEFRKFYKENGL
jgi:glycosyltransferase involved in cell wall biosynthesis